MDVPDAWRLRELETENGKLEKLLAEPLNRPGGWFRGSSENTQNFNHVPRRPCCSTPGFAQSQTPAAKIVCSRVVWVALNATL